MTAASFVRSTDPSPSPRRVVRRARLGVAALATAAALALGGCSGTPNTSGPVAGGAPAGAPTAPNTAAAPPAATAAQRQVTRTAELTVQIADPAQAAAKVRGIAQTAGGYVSQEVIYTEQVAGAYVRPSTVTLAVPADKLDATLDSLAALGQVQSRTVRSEDVTAATADVDARIATQRESIARIRALMAQAGNVRDIAAIEAELTSRQAQLESLLAQQKALAGRVAMSPITVSLRTEKLAATPNPVVEGLADGWEALLVSVRMVLTLLGALLPYAAVALLIGWPVVALRRRARQRRAVAVAKPDAGRDGAPVASRKGGASRVAPADQLNVPSAADGAAATPGRDTPAP